jgi:broad specificity phosphatase PhoE
MANTLIAIRHPEKEGDIQGVYRGNADTITPNGQMQITEVIDRIRYWDERPELVISSAIPRAITLAGFVASELGLNFEINELFNEIDKPEFLVGERRDSDLHERTMREIREMFDLVTTPEGIQVCSRSQLEEQTRETFAYLESLPCETVLLVGHAKRIASYAHWIYHNETLHGYYETADRNLKLSPTGISVFKREPDRRNGEQDTHWHVDCWNDTAHLMVQVIGNPILTSLTQALDKKET